MAYENLDNKRNANKNKDKAKTNPKCLMFV